MQSIIQCEEVSFHEIDFSDRLFESLRLDYPGFDVWRANAIGTAELRCAYIVRTPQGAYAAIAIIKIGEGPNGPSPAGLKISTFKVDRESQARGLADLLLSRVFEKAIRIQADVIFTTLLPGHEDMARYLELRGFRRAARELERGERIYVAELTNPDRIYSQLNRLAFDLLAEEYRARAESPGPSQEGPEYLAGLLASRLPSPIRRVLELGPGSGTVLSALGKISADTVAVEISPNMAAVAALRPRKRLLSLPMCWRWISLRIPLMASMRELLSTCFHTPRLLGFCSESLVGPGPEAPCS